MYAKAFLRRVNGGVSSFRGSLNFKFIKGAF